ncbi:hypothetical protein M758_11G102000 [Ceratodon purpureus]|nr:hypothetical protein M758_11G102000 [Ceratodon purpureus]
MRARKGGERGGQREREQRSKDRERELRLVRWLWRDHGHGACALSHTDATTTPAFTPPALGALPSHAHSNDLSHPARAHLFAAPSPRARSLRLIANGPCALAIRRGECRCGGESRVPDSSVEEFCGFRLVGLFERVSPLPSFEGARSLADQSG